ncbi:MAG: S8 family serine peptidase, partial [Pseudomonadota bacterium]
QSQAPSPWSPANTTGEAFLNMREAGIFVASSAGNSGPGNGTVSVPANAPWITAVASVSHDRRVVNNAIDGFTGGTGPLQRLAGESQTGGFGPARIVHARDFGHPLCGIGDVVASGTCVDNGSNPFPPGTFNGEIVVCDRGIYGRVEKGFNLREAGAGGYVLANSSSEGEATANDAHCLPAVHLGVADGDLLRDWLATGADHRAELVGVFEPETDRDARFGSVVSGFSSRGPDAIAPDLMKPDIAAPGQAIRAASRLGTQETFISGTSMASPHVAGAAALVLAAQPGLSPDRVHAALATTAEAGGMRVSGGAPAGALDVGAGLLRVDEAVSAGLVLPVTPAEFTAANPAAGGDPSSLNLPGLATASCIGSCRFERRVEAVVAGAWSVVFDAPPGVSVAVEPASFELGAGESVDLAITVNVVNAGALVGSRADGVVRLVPGGPGVPPTGLAFSVVIDPGPVPEELTVVADASFGTADLTLPGLVPAFPAAAFRTTGLGRLGEEERALGQDSVRSSPYDSLIDGVYYVTVEVAAGGLVFAETLAGLNGDLDLFIGADTNFNGLPDADEERCASTSATAIERCLEVADRAGTWWILVQNWASSAPGARDGVAIRYAGIDPGGTALTVTGPGSAPGSAPVPVRVTWDEGRLAAGERWLGLLEPLADRRAGAGSFGQIPLIIDRSAGSVAAPRAYALRPGAPASVGIEPGAVQDRLFFDVPTGASRVAVAFEAADPLSVRLQRNPHEFAAPEVLPAGGEALAAMTDAAGVLTLDAPASGRYHVVLDNGGSEALAVTVTATIESATESVDPLPGLYFNPDRDGHGINLNTAGDQLVIEWYTYLEDGTPTWYLAQGPAPTVGGQWQADLLRFSWDGGAAVGVDVGDVMLTFEDEAAFVFSFRVHGESGTERMIALAPEPGCDVQGAVAERTGLWFDPASPGYGYSVLGVAGNEVYINYLFDGAGVPRWALAQGDGSPGSLALLQFEGFCPTCARAVGPPQPVGVINFGFDDPQTGRIGAALEFVAPVGGFWERGGDVSNLAPAFDCSGG